MLLAVIVPFLLCIFSPLFLLSVLVGYSLSSVRIKRERRQFRVAVNKNMLEFKQFFSGISLGLIISVVCLFAGFIFSGEWLIIYMILAFICLLTFWLNGLLPAITLGFAGFIFYFFHQTMTELLQPVLAIFHIQKVTATDDIGEFSVLILFFVGLLMLWLASQLKLQENTRYASPKLIKRKRGSRFATYFYRGLWLCPVLFIVPGDIFGSTLTWWPTISLGSQTYALMCIPFILGFRFKLTNQKLIQGQIKYRKDIQLVGIFSILLGDIAYFMPVVTGYCFVLLVLAGLGIIIRHKIRERKEGPHFTDVSEGLRIIGIQPDTPAEKMALEIGEVIVACNHQEVHSETMLHAAILVNPAYCHLKILADNGEYRVTETAIYEDSPHNLGLILFPDNVKLSSSDMLITEHVKRIAAEKSLTTETTNSDKEKSKTSDL